jgi:hypothetical protein
MLSTLAAVAFILAIAGIFTAIDRVAAKAEHRRKINDRIDRIFKI